MKKSIYLLSLLFIFCAVFALPACKRTEEGLKNDWKFAKERWDKHKKNYPALGALLDKQLKDAEAIMAEADKLSNFEEKTKKVGEAVAAINTGFIAELNTVEYNKDEIKKKTEKIKKQKFGKANLKKAENALIDGDNAVAEAERILKNSVATNDEASAAAKEANKVLSNAKKGLDAVAKLK